MNSKCSLIPILILFACTLPTEFARARSNVTIPGGPLELTGDNLQEAVSLLERVLSKLSQGDGPSYRMSKVYTVTVQVVAGHLLKYEADLVDLGTNEKERCEVSIWSRPWLKEPADVLFKCKNALIAANYSA